MIAQWKKNDSVYCCFESCWFTLLRWNNSLVTAITTTHLCAFHIDTTTLADGTYELVPETESEQREAQVNLTEAAQELTSFTWKQ